jgi:hypothetical protein
MVPLFYLPQKPWFLRRVLSQDNYLEIKIEKRGQLVSDTFLTLLSWVVEAERQKIRTAQREGIEIAKGQGKFRCCSFEIKFD